VTRSAEEVGAGLAPVRAPRPIRAGERIHVVGVAGAGASGAALLAVHAGGEVSGCDPGAPSPYTAALEAMGVTVDSVHAAGHVGPADHPLVDRIAVTKALTAVDPDHPELMAARAAGLPVEAWQQLVADAAATQGGLLVAVAGTHGKSTSTGWLLHLLARAGAEPAGFVGALLPGELCGGIPSTALWGRGPFVVEADEYAGNFDPYRPQVAVLLNVEWDHPDVFADEPAVRAAFLGWLRAPGSAGRTLVANVGDAGVARLLGELAGWEGRIVRVALDAPEGAAEVAGRVAGEGIVIEGLGAPIVVERLALPGLHNAANALCVAAAAALAGASAGAIAEGLASFPGVGRRLERKGEPAGVLVLDDYAHHPTAISAVIATLRRQWPGRRVWAVCEPLTFHRTAALADALAVALAAADRVTVAPIHAGRDPDRTIASAAAVAEAVDRLGTPATAPATAEETADEVADAVRSGDLVIVMGGGRADRIADRIVDRLTARAGG